MKYDVIVVGAGIIGCSIALRLGRGGMKVLLIDKIGPAAGASFGNAGMVGPNAVVPMVMPGFLSQMPKLMLGVDSSVSIRPSGVFPAARWLQSCVRAAREENVEATCSALSALHHDTIAGWRALLGDAQFHDLFHTGRTFCLIDPRHVVNGEPRDRATQLRRRHGIMTRLATAEEMLAGFPGIALPDLAYSAIDDTASVLNPGRLVVTLFEAFLRVGGDYRQCAAQAFELDGRRVRALLTNEKRWYADRYVVSGGAGSLRLLPKLPYHVPFIAERGYHVMLKTASPVFSAAEGARPCVLLDTTAKRVISEMEEGVCVAGFVEYGAESAAPDEKKYRALLRHFQRLFPGHEAQVTRTWFGHRPSTPDGVPYLGHHPAAANLITAFGHGHYGMSGAPKTAELVERLLTARKTANELSPYDIRRFHIGASSENRSLT